jgi:hypothetical protein
LVTGAFGLAGVLTGGAISYRVQSRQIDSQQNAATAQDRKVARGTARLMNVEFRSRVDAMDAALGPKAYPKGHISIATSLSADDQRSVASELAPMGWSTVAAGAAKIGRAQRLLDRHPGRPLSATDAVAARTYRQLFQRAAMALAKFDAQSG